MLAHSPAGTPEVLEIAKASARKALAIDPELPEGYASLALIKQYDDWDWNGLEHDFRRALELNPTDAELRRHYSWYLMLFKRPDEALAEMRRARADDPLGGVYYSDLGMQLAMQGRDDEALAEARRGVELDPENYNNLYGLGTVYRKKGMLDRAIEVDRKLVKVEPLFKWTLAYSLALAGRGAEAQPIVDEMRRATDSWSAYGLAHVYVAKGDKDEALRWLEVARQRRCVWMPWVGVGAELVPLRGDPRFVKVLAAIGVPNVEPGFGQPKT
jgi:Tfp pilus assembly protein PilF